MKNVTRRGFITGATTIVAGSALGITAGIRRYGPIEIRTYFLAKDPIVIQGSLEVDARQDLFRINALGLKDGPVAADMPLSGIKAAMETGLKRLCVRVANLRMKTSIVYDVVVDRENVTFCMKRIPMDDSRIWLKLHDVQQVV